MINPLSNPSIEAVSEKVSEIIDHLNTHLPIEDEEVQVERELLDEQQHIGNDIGDIKTVLREIMSAINTLAKEA